MVSVKEPDFAVLVNGMPTQWFRYTTRLRHGDPLSPYLFISGADVFLRMVKRAQTNGALSGGVRIRLGEERVSQLAYADDSSLFLKASPQEVKVTQYISSTAV